MTPASKRAASDTAQVTERRRTYLAALAPDVRKGVERLRKAIRSASPDSIEGFSYGMPSFVLDGQPLLWYAAWKKHYGLYPVSAAAIAEHAPAVSGHEIAKGTIRFSHAEPPSDAVIRQVVAARLADIGK